MLKLFVNVAFVVLLLFLVAWSKGGSDNLNKVTSASIVALNQPTLP